MYIEALDDEEQLEKYKKCLIILIWLHTLSRSVKGGGIFLIQGRGLRVGLSKEYSIFSLD
jgi:hypothetical protein